MKASLAILLTGLLLGPGAVFSEEGMWTLDNFPSQTIKNKYGLIGSGNSIVLDGRISSTQIISLLRPKLETLVTEIQRSLAFYHEKQKPKHD